MTPKIVSLIPARGGSKRIPLKNIRLLNGKPLLSYVIEASLRSCVDETWVSTEDEEIKRIAIDYGAKVIDRPSELAEDDATTEQVIHHFINNIKTDIVVIIEPPHPLVKSEDINAVLDIMLKGNYDSVVSLERQKIFIWEIENNKIVPRYNPAARPKTQNYEGVLVENVGIWATTTKAFLKSGVRISGNIGYYICPHKSIDIDEEIDLIIAEALLNETISHR
ncbi:MAG TPA: acylneuraminate cytidylyltransferase family protein [Candidatus Atribacteria bacterium]|nr:acylneuraminate cytidylyltransferase family protein [Candidatus Atribacteria bacterium]